MPVMKIHELFVALCLSFVVFSAHAAWQVAKPCAVPREPFFQGGPQPRTYAASSRTYAAPPSRTYVAPRRVYAPQRTPFVPAAPAVVYGARVFPNQYANLGQPVAIYAVSISGSLKENVERIMSRYHWRVVWKAPYDYNFDGRVTGSSLPNVLEKLLQPFPLQAVMYMSNRTVAVVPRRKA